MDKKRRFWADFALSDCYDAEKISAYFSRLTALLRAIVGPILALSTAFVHFLSIFGPKNFRLASGMEKNSVRIICNCLGNCRQSLMK